MSPREKTYTEKEVMMSRPSVVQRVKESEGSTITARSIVNQGEPSYKNNFVGKNLKTISEMGGLQRINSDTTQNFRYTDSEDYLQHLNRNGHELSAEIPTDLDEIHEIFEDIYRGRVVDAFEQIGKGSIEVVEDIEQKGIRFRGCSEPLKPGETGEYSEIDEDVKLARLRPDYSEPTLQFLSELSLIDRDAGRKITADLRDVKFLVNEMDDWRAIAENLENGIGLPNWAENDLRDAKSYFRED